MTNLLRQNKKLSKGFTLIELLVVISIIGLLSSVLFAGVNTAKDKAGATKAMQEVRQYRTALSFYFSDHGYFPSPSTAIPSCLGRTDSEWCPINESYGDTILYNALLPYFKSMPKGDIVSSPNFFGGATSDGYIYTCANISPCYQYFVLWKVPGGYSKCLDQNSSSISGGFTVCYNNYSN